MKRYTSLLLVVFLLIAPITISQQKIEAADTLGIKSGEIYYIRNKVTGNYLDARNVNVANNKEVLAATFNGNTAQQWRVTRNLDDSYTFVSVLSTTGRAINISGSTNVVTYNADGTYYQRFNLIRTSDGVHNIKYNYSSTYVTENASNSKIIVTSKSSRSEWSFELKDKGYADFFCFDYNYYNSNGDLVRYNTTGSFIDFKYYLEGSGYSNIYRGFNSYPVEAYNSLNDDIFVFRGHGLSFIRNNESIPASTICFFSQGGISNGYLSTNSNVVNNNVNNRFIDDLAYNALAKNRCTLYIGCSTGVTYTKTNGLSYNLVDSTYNKGAHFVLGTTQTTYASQTNVWTIAFFEKVYAGGTIYDCIDYANETQNIGELYFLGDDTIKLNQ